MIVFLDSGVLGQIVNPNQVGGINDCLEWLYGLMAKGVDVRSSELCDYEVRRSLILETRSKPYSNSLYNLNALQQFITFLSVASEVLLQAAEIWASARSQGIPTADNKSLDADVIICAHWQILKEEFPGRYVVIATGNVKHLSRFAEAKNWREIKF